MCAAPFSGGFAPLMRLAGRQQSEGNPNWCNSCFSFLSRNHGGAEITITVLFADIRGSTALAEKTSATSFRALLDRFYSTSTRVVFDHDGYVDKFVGDELVAMFFPLMSGERHAARAVETATALLEATGHADRAGPWAPLGVGVHTGEVWFGAIGEGSHVELTAVGDAVNATARLASMARAGEVLVTVEAATLAGVDSSLPRETLEIRGKTQGTEVVRLTVSPQSVGR